MPDEVERLTVAVGADTALLASAFSGVGGLTKKLGSTISGIGSKITGVLGSTGTIVAAGLVIGTIAIAKFAMSAQKDIGAGTRAIRTGTGATGKSLDALKGSMISVGKTVPQSFSEVGVAIAKMNSRLGLTGKPLEDVTRQVVNLSRMTGVDLNNMIDLTAKTFADWGISTKNQAGSLDFLWKVSHSTGIGIDSLAEKVTKFGAPLRGMGYSFQESAVLIGQFDKAGVNTDQVMMSMKKGLGELAKAGENPKQALSRLVKEIKNAKTPAEATTIALKTFGARGGVEMADAIRKGTFSIDDMMKKLKGSKETINKAGDDTLTFGQRMKVLGNNVKPLLAPLGKGIFIALNWAVKGLIAAVKWISELIKKIQTGGGTFKTLREIIVVVFKAIVVAVKVIWAALKTFFTVLFKILAIQFKVWVWIIGKIIIPIFKGIVATIKLIWNVVAGYFRFIFKVWKGIWNLGVAALKLIWGGIKKVWNAVIGPLIRTVKAVWNAVSKAWSYVWGGKDGKGGISGAIKAVWNAIKKAWHTIIDPLINTVKFLWNGIGKVWKTLWEGKSGKGGIKGVLTGVWSAIKKAWHIVFDPLWKVIKFVWNGIGAAWKKSWEGIWKVLSFQWRLIQRLWNDTIGKIPGLGGKTTVKVPKVSAPAGSASDKFNKTFLPWMHGGGEVSMTGGYFLKKKEGVLNPEAMRSMGSAAFRRANSGLAPAGGGASVSIGDIYVQSVSEAYDAGKLKRIVRKEMDDVARQGYHAGKNK